MVPPWQGSFRQWVCPGLGLGLGAPGVLVLEPKRSKIGSWFVSHGPITPPPPPLTSGLQGRDEEKEEGISQCNDEREILKKSKTSSSENARLTGEVPSCATLTYRCRCWWWSELRSPKKGGNPTRRWPKIQSSEKPSLANLRLGRILETRGEIEKKEEKV